MESSPPLGQRPRILLQGKAAGFHLSPFEMIILLAVMLVTAFAAYTVYARSTDLNAVPPAASTYLPAFRNTLTSSVSATGTVQATQQVTLTFGSAGKISQFLVKLGDRVVTGQALARIDDTDLQQALNSANASLASTQASYTARTAGPSATDIASGQQSVVTATSSVATAQKNIDDLKAGPKAADIATAQQGVNTAQTSLQTAQDAVPKAQNDIVTAQQGVTTAQNGVTTAQNGVITAQNGVQTAQNALDAARTGVTTANTNITTARNNLATAQNDVDTAITASNTSYTALSVNGTNYNTALATCRTQTSGYALPANTVLVGLPSVFVSQGDTAQTLRPLYTNEACYENASSGTPTPTRLGDLKTQISAYNGATSSYNSAVAGITTKRNAVTTAQNAVTTANNALTTAQNGADKASNDVDTANRAVVTAQTGVTDAQAKVAAAQVTLQTAQNASTNGNLQRAIDNARLGLQTAQQKLTDTLAGPTQADLDAAQRSLESANASLAAAQSRYDDIFKAPGPEVLLPLQAQVAQSVANVETAKKNLAAATIIAPFDGQISQITGDIGTQVSAATAVFILLNPNLIRIDANVDQADIGNLKVGQTATITFDALAGRSYNATVAAIGLTPTTQQGVVTYVVNFAVDTSRLATGVPIPTPGMTATISVTTSRVDAALVVPTRAIRRTGRTSTVTVKGPNGDEQRTVVTGATNGTLTQITSGLNEGDEVLVSAARTTTTTTTTGTGGGGNTPFGGGGGGGFTPPGGAGR